MKFLFVFAAVALSANAASFPSCASSCVKTVYDKLGVDFSSGCSSNNNIQAQSTFLTCASHACSFEEQEAVNEALTGACADIPQPVDQVQTFIPPNAQATA